MPLCPFYGKQANPLIRALMPTGGNRCALITEAHTPCKLELEGDQAPQLENCEMNGSARAVTIAGYHEDAPQREYPD